MQDFIPEGKEEVGTKTLFVDFIPTPTLKEIKDYDSRAKARAEAKAKKEEPVVLTEQQIEEFKAMEEETAKEMIENGETPIENEIEAEVEADIPAEIQVTPETEILPTPSKKSNKRTGKRR